MLRRTAAPLSQVYDVALLDLDGVVYVGGDAVPNAATSLQTARDVGMRLAFVTNNAARPPEVVAEHLTDIGVPAVPEEVVTSAQAAARSAAEILPKGAAVLLVGGPGLHEALQERGLRPVSSLDDDPVAVVQGFDPTITWTRLAEGAYAIQRDLPWIVSNTDLTIPTPRGRGPGNGTLVRMLATASGREPLLVAGKPEPPMHREAMIRTQATKPLVVGDRLDTDIEGAIRGGVDSILVFTGVTDPAHVVVAPAHLRPTFLSTDLRGLHEAHRAPAAAEDGMSWRCGGWVAAYSGGHLRIDNRHERSSGEGADTATLDGIRAACAAVWAAADAGLASPDPAQIHEALSRVGLHRVQTT